MSDNQTHQESEKVVDVLSDSANFDTQDILEEQESDMMFHEIQQELNGERDYDESSFQISDSFSGTEVEDESLAEPDMPQANPNDSNQSDTKIETNNQFEDLFLHVGSSEVGEGASAPEQEKVLIDGNDTSSPSPQAEQPNIPSPEVSDEVKTGDNVAINESKAVPWYFKPNVMIAGILGILVLFFGGIVWLIFGSLNLDSTAPSGAPITQQVNSFEPQPSYEMPTEELLFNEQLEPDTPAPDIQSNITSTDQMFNGVDIIHVVNDADYTNIDPITKSMIDRLKGALIESKAQVSAHEVTIQQHLSTIENYETQTQELKRHVEKLSSEKQAITQKWQNSESMRVALNNELSEKNETIRNLRIEIETEKRLTDREKQGRILAEKRYTELQTAQSQEFLGMQTAISQLGARFDDVMKEKKTQEAKKLLAQLTYLDILDGVGRFVVMKNGKPIKEITLSKGEPLVGRGVVSSVDRYGCITFEDGKQYQPLNGYCP